MLKVLPDLEDGVWKVSKDSMNFAILSRMIVLRMKHLIMSIVER